ncbi:MAG: M20 family metallo-hydrolase [Clostridia bacterium]|nr:M20 family metallo-hydrolase [Clostridia bacterium]
MKEKIKLEEFFAFGENEPIQRLAYSKEDVDYKVKIIKKMQELGMKIKVDKVGNICATLKGNGKSNKSIILGSHTDSVKDGGQYDGPVGVLSGLKVIEEIIQKVEDKKLDLDCDLKVVIWACEESNRFGKACLGSKWVEGTLEEKDFEMKEKLDKKEEDKLTLGKAINEYMEYLKSADIEPMESVDKILSIEEILKAYEIHIEQYQYLYEHGIDVGIVNSITAPYRMEVEIKGKDVIVDAATLVVKLNERAKEAEKDNKYRATVPIIDIKQERISDSDFFFNIELLGKDDHSGATPMARRKDAVLTASKFVLELNRRIKEEAYPFKVYFEEINTKNDSMNKVSGNSNILLGIDANGLSKEIITDILSLLVEDVAKGEGVKSSSKKIGRKLNRRYEKLNNKCNEEKCEMKLDVRMQTKTNPEEMFTELTDTISAIAKETGNNYYCQKTDKAEPVKTSTKMANQVEEVCNERGVKSVIMPSWAGHDVAHISIPEKMLLFIKSTGGSHNPLENTTKQDIEKGIIALEGTVEEDIKQVNRVVCKMEYLNNNSISGIVENENTRTKKGAIRKILFGMAEARKLGVEVPKKVQKEIRQEIMVNRDNIEK